MKIINGTLPDMATLSPDEAALVNDFRVMSKEAKGHLICISGSLSKTHPAWISPKLTLVQAQSSN